MSRPFFIVGCGRSGTTYLRTLLTRHPQIAIPLESLFMVDYLRAGADVPLSQLKAWIIMEPELAEWGLQPSVDDLAQADNPSDILRQLHRLYAQQEECEVWGQKTPRFVRYLDLLHASFPEAAFIHIVRDPRAVVSSLIRSDVHRSTAYHGAKRWSQDVSAGLVFERDHQELVLRLKYEELVRHPEKTLRNVLKHIGLEFSPVVLSPEEEALEEYSNFYENIHANLVRPPMEENIDKWMRELSTREIELVEAMCLEPMRMLGYEPINKKPSASLALIIACHFQRSIRSFGQLWRYLRYRRSYFLHLLHRKYRLGLLREFLGRIHQ